MSEFVSPFGEIVLLGTETGSGGAGGVSFQTIVPEIWNKIWIVGTNIDTITLAGVLQLTISDDDGATYKSTGYDWSTRQQTIASGAIATQFATAAAAIALSGSLLTPLSTTRKMSLSLMFEGPTGNSRRPCCWWDLITGDGVMVRGAGQYTSVVTGVNRLKITASAGTLNGTNFRMYGIKL